MQNQIQSQSQYSDNKALIRSTLQESDTDFCV